MPERTYTDSDLLDFLKALDKSEANVSEWEMQFIESNLDTRRFTDRQRQSVLKMIQNYAARIGWT